MTRTMYDSIDPAAIPAGATMIAAYVDGYITHDNYTQVRARFPRARIVRITVTGGTLDADVVDIEQGDCSPASGAAWARCMVDAGRTPTCYMSLNSWPQVQAAVKAEGIEGKVAYWVADYDEHATIPPGAVAKQFIDHGPNGENYDVSVVADYWPGVDPPPQHPTPKADDDMKLIQVHGDQTIYLMGVGTKWRVPDVATLSALKAVLSDSTTHVVPACLRDALTTVYGH